MLNIVNQLIICEYIYIYIYVWETNIEYSDLMYMLSIAHHLYNPLHPCLDSRTTTLSFVCVCVRVCVCACVCACVYRCYSLFK